MNRRSSIVAVLATFLTNLALVSIPLPMLAIVRRFQPQKRDASVAFIATNPSMIAMYHLLWLSVATTAVLAYNDLIGLAAGQWPQLPQGARAYANVVWLATLVATMFFQAVPLTRMRLLLASALSALGGSALLTALNPQAIVVMVCQALDALPIGIEWGVPAIVATVLAVGLSWSLTTSMVQNRWSLRNDLLEHQTPETDEAIPLSHCTVRVVYDCILRRVLLFGIGTVELRVAGADGAGRVIQINGVLFASVVGAEIASAARSSPPQIPPTKSRIASKGSEEVDHELAALID